MTEPRGVSRPGEPLKTSQPLKIAALVVAAGIGARARGAHDELPKQYRPINALSATTRAVFALASHSRIKQIVVARHKDHKEFCDSAIAAVPHELQKKLLPCVVGGAERSETVLRGMRAMAMEPPDIVLIHDAARPFLRHEVIDRVLTPFNDAMIDGACVGLPLVDAVHRTGPSAGCIASLAREGLWRAQTPQAFRFTPYQVATQNDREPALDDVELARRNGLKIVMVQGDDSLQKITCPEDFAWAERMTVPLLEPRIGAGFDVHAFGPNADGSTDHVMLCGVATPHNTGLTGHSDADVGLHALTDAILGALSMGDIGAHFPPTDPRWHGTSSDKFLKHAMGFVEQRGGKVSQLDVTLICERPKIGPHIKAMKRKIANICGLSPDRVSVKATTTEKLGFTGREEGIAAMAVASLLIPPF